MSRMTSNGISLKMKELAESIKILNRRGNTLSHWSTFSFVSILIVITLVGWGTNEWLTSKNTTFPFQKSQPKAKTEVTKLSLFRNNYYYLVKNSNYLALVIFSQQL